MPDIFPIRKETNVTNLSRSLIELRCYRQQPGVELLHCHHRIPSDAAALRTSSTPATGRPVGQIRVEPLNAFIEDRCSLRRDESPDLGPRFATERAVLVSDVATPRRCIRRTPRLISSSRDRSLERCRRSASAGQDSDIGAYARTSESGALRGASSFRGQIAYRLRNWKAEIRLSEPGKGATFGLGARV